jgi:hypothetical protein
MLRALRALIGFRRLCCNLTNALCDFRQFSSFYDAGPALRNTDQTLDGFGEALDLCGQLRQSH